MNYLSQINAFWDSQEEMELSSSEIALWFALMNINNRLSWKDSFSKASSIVREQSGLSERNFFTVRNSLQQKGLIEVKSRKGNKSAVYKIKVLYEELPANNAHNSSDSEADKGAYSGSDNSAPLVKPETNTETETVLEEDEDELVIYNARVATQKFWEEQFKTLTAFQQNKLDLYTDHYGQNLVISAIRITAQYNPDIPFQYFENVLSDLQKELTT